MGNTLKTVEDPETGPENHNVMQSDRVYVACWFQKYAKNQLKTEFLSKKTLLGENDAKSPKF